MHVVRTYVSEIDDSRCNARPLIGRRVAKNRKTHRPAKPLTRPFRESKLRTYSRGRNGKERCVKRKTHTRGGEDCFNERLVCTQTHYKHTLLSSLKINAAAPFNEVACKLCIAVRLHAPRPAFADAARYFRARRYDKTGGITDSVIRDNGREIERR